jgi:hypothetical protein
VICQMSWDDEGEVGRLQDDTHGSEWPPGCSHMNGAEAPGWTQKLVVH